MAKIREHQLKRILEQMSSKDKLLIDIGDLEAKKHSLLHARILLLRKWNNTNLRWKTNTVQSI